MQGRQNNYSSSVPCHKNNCFYKYTPYIPLTDVMQNKRQKALFREMNNETPWFPMTGPPPRI
jgi:hypothetical protein